MDITLGYAKNDVQNKKTDNSRNGYTPKSVKTQMGPLELDIPRDRDGEFEPKIVPKYKRDISGIEEKVISLYARGMSTRDIHDQIKDLYGIELSAEMVSKITERILPEIKEWQNRPLESIYPFAFINTAAKNQEISSPVLSVIENNLSRKAFRRNWARLIQKVYHTDPLVCPKCVSA